PSLDPGPEAVSLVLEKGQARFMVSSAAAGAKVRIAPIEPATVAARAPEPDGCREMRDDYHAELGATACTSSSDCDVVGVLELPGEAVPTGTCSAYLNKGTAADLKTLSQRFVATCEASTSVCNAPDPPGCVAGRCAAICVGALLPSCPPACAHFPSVDFGEGHACDSNIECFAADGRRCACVAGVVACKADPPYSASCPYSCRPNPANGDTTYVDRTDGGAASTTDAQAPA